MPKSPVASVARSTPLSVTISGPPRWLVLRTQAGHVVAAVTTNVSGHAVISAPDLPDLRLDVLGTEAVDIPVRPGMTLRIVIP